MDVKMLDDTSHTTFSYNTTTDFQQRVKLWLEEWVPENHHVIDEFVRLSKLLKQRGRNHYGGQAIQEYLRFSSAIAERGSEFKLNNDNVALITRYLMLKYSDLDDFFRVRKINGLSKEKANSIMRSAMRSAGEIPFGTLL